MIRFACSNCAKQLSVKDELAGHRGRCRQCGTVLTIPAASAFDPSGTSSHVRSLRSAEPSPNDGQRISLTSGGNAGPTDIKRKVPMRIRRLQSDAEQMRRVFHKSPIIHIAHTTGEPPTHYTLEYRVRGLARGRDGKPEFRDRHTVEIRLTSEYPRQSPVCRVLTPIFHPNIEPAVICVGDHWTAAERLTDLVIRIGEMIAYQTYNIQSPLDGEAAMWADLNRQRLPIDARDLHPADRD